MIALSINVSLLDKDRFIKGQKGTYCNLVLIETPNSEFGDYMCKQDMSKEDRENGVRMPILGNAKMRVKANSPAPKKEVTVDEDGEEIPF